MAKVSKVQKIDGTVIMDISGDTVAANNLLEGARAHGSDGEEVQGAVNLNDYVQKSGDTMTGSLTLKPTSNSGTTQLKLQSTAIDRDGADPASNITSNSEFVMLDKDGERLARIVVSRQTTGEQRLIISAYNEASGTEKANTFRLSVLKDGTVDYALTDPGKFRSVIGAAANNHNQAADTINSMTGYSKPATTSAITTSDTLNAAMGKLEKENEILRDALFQSTYIIPEGTTTISDTTITDKTKCFYYIPNSVTSIGYNAFSFCKILTSIVIPSSITSIGNAAFYNCTSLKIITIPNSVTSIEDYAFNECTSLTDIIINKPRDSISGAPWGAPNATVWWTG